MYASSLEQKQNPPSPALFPSTQPAPYHTPGYEYSFPCLHSTCSGCPETQPFLPVHRLTVQFLLSHFQFMIPSVDKGTHGRRRANFCPCFVAFLPRTSSTRQSSASQGQKLTSFRLSDPDHRYFGNLQGGRLRRTGRTLIEDNAENYRNIMVQGVCALVY